MSGVTPRSAGVVLAVMAAAVCYVRTNAEFAIDDSYITFTYARNLAEGRGLVFNEGERAYGTTAAGYAVLLAALHRSTGLPIPLSSVVLSAIGLLLVWVFVVEGFRSLECTWLAGALAVLTGLWLLWSPLGSMVAGHETPFFVGLLALALWLVFDRRRPVPGFVVFALAFIVRPDGALMFALAAPAAFVTLPATSRRPVVTGVFLGALLAGGWLLAMRAWFGSFLPTTLKAKQAQYDLWQWEPYTPRGVSRELEAVLGVVPWELSAAVVSFAVLVVSARALRSPSHRTLLLPTLAVFLCWGLFAAGSLFTYLQLRVTLWRWYVVPIALALFATTWRAVAQLIFAAAQPGRRHTRRWALAWAGAAVAAATTGADVATAVPVILGPRHENPHLVAYQPVIDFLERDGTGGGLIAMPEPGSFKYHLQRPLTVVDTLGLISPNVAEALHRRDFGFVLRELRPLYVIESVSGPFSPATQQGFAENYEEVFAFSSPYWGNTRVALFKRRGDPGKHRGPGT